VPSASPTNTRLSALWVLDPDKAIAVVANVLAEERGDMKHAAIRLRVARQTLYRWVQANQRLRSAVVRARYEAKEEAKR
jgi:hypothetical protein